MVEGIAKQSPGVLNKFYFISSGLFLFFMFLLLFKFESFLRHTVLYRTAALSTDDSLCTVLGNRIIFSIVLLGTSKNYQILLNESILIILIKYLCATS